MKSLISSIVVAGALFGASTAAQAAPCTASSPLTDPDATITHSTLCGTGILNDNNDSAADLNTLGVGGLSIGWSELAKIEEDETTDGVLMATGLDPAGSSGDWGFDSVAGFANYVLVIKDGGSPGGNAPNSIFWDWFVVDLSAGCSLGSFAGLKTYCGTWSMYGDNGNIKKISHLTLYGNAGVPVVGVPEPSSFPLVVLALGLLGYGHVIRRRHNA